MEISNPLKVIATLDEILGVYRDYFKYQLKTKIWKIIRLFFELVLCFVISYNGITAGCPNVYENLNPSCLFFFCFNSLSFVIDVDIILRPLHNSNNYRILFKRFSITLDHFERVKKQLKLLNLFVTVLIIVFSIIRLVITITGRFYTYKYGSYSIVYYHLMVVFELWLKVRRLYETVTFVTFSYTILRLLADFNEEISSVERRLEDCKDEDMVLKEDVISSWVTVHESLAVVCQELTECFGVQILYSMWVCFIHYIFMTYRMLNTVLQKVEYENFRLSDTVYIIVYRLVTICTVIFLVQMIHNKAATLNRTVARLYNTVSLCPREDEVRSVRDFLRVVNSNPMRIELMSNVPIGTYLIPIFLSLAVTYVIFILQLNHVV